MSSGISSANARNRVKFCQNRPSGCGDIAILQFFSKIAAAVILDFQKSNFLSAITFDIPNLRYCDKFHQDRKIRCRDMANFRFVKMAAVWHVGFLKLQF